MAKWEGKLQPSTREHVMTELLRLATAVRMPNDVEPKPMLKLYAEDLVEYPPDVLTQACIEWRRTQKFWPTIAELIALMEPRRRHRREMLGYARGAA